MIPKRQPVASPEILAQPYGAAIAGWEQLTVELSAGSAGLRHVLVVLDATGQPISASDTVLYRVESPAQGEAGQISSPIEQQFYCLHDAPFRLRDYGGSDLACAATMAKFCDVAVVVVGYTYLDEG